jgi:hypothetical protein
MRVPRNPRAEPAIPKSRSVVWYNSECGPLLTISRAQDCVGDLDAKVARRRRTSVARPFAFHSAVSPMQRCLSPSHLPSFIAFAILLVRVRIPLRVATSQPTFAAHVSASCSPSPSVSPAFPARSPSSFTTLASPRALDTPPVSRLSSPVLPPLSSLPLLSPLPLPAFVPPPSFVPPHHTQQSPNSGLRR